MERNNIQLSIGQLFGGNNQFVVPLYQRNFAWGEDEITQLMQDLYESYQEDNGSHTKTYFVGSIIYIRRKNSAYQLEVIDGQQRLTAFTLLLNVLGKELLPGLFSSKLNYDSRDEVQMYLNKLYSGNKSNDSTAVIETFQAATQTIETCTLDPEKSEKEENSITQLREQNPEELKKFAEYISSNVYFVLAEMPQDTDVATYFEIMNNTGDQLKKHEIVKSLILGSAQNRLNVKELESLAMIWDACSQMDVYVQEAIPAKKRSLLFGKDFDSFLPENILELSDTQNDEEQGENIENIIKDDNYQAKDKKETENEDDIENTGASIIDFPNFLMHVFRICYNQEYQEKYDGNDIPLNEKDLLSVFNSIKNFEDFKAEDFIQHLLYYRIIFDRYIVKREDIDGDEKWSLQYVIKHSANNGVQPRNTFGKGYDDEDHKGQDKVIKALSMLQVSYPQRKYKRFLNEILSWFKYKPKHPETSFDLNWYLPKLNALISHYIYDVMENYSEELYHLGTSTPRFILNVVDYLLYLSSDNCSDFDFKYYNSVEHHLPQSREYYNEECDAQTLDSIGNLFLLSRRANSSLNDRDPMAKADKAGSLDKMPPNRKFIYQQTRKNRRWSVEDIKEHTEAIIQLLSKQKEILKVNELEDSLLLYRACLCVKDYCLEDGTSGGGTKWDFTKLENEEGQEAKQVIADWLNKHPRFEMEDFIKEQLQDNAELEADSWRWCFVKYPSVMEYCQDGKFAWIEEGESIIIYLLPNNRMCKDAHELREHIANEILEGKGLNTFINQDGIGIPMMENNIGNGWKDPETWLHIWVEGNAQHWCYEIRTTNDSEAKNLRKNGWIKNDADNYYLADRPYLCDCPSDYRVSIKKAIKSINEMLKLLSKI